MSKTYFRTAAARLAETARKRIRAGETSERRLARLTAVSQPHMHNILMGKRALLPHVADSLLDVLALSLEELLAEQPETASDVAVPWLAGPLGGGRAHPGVSAQPPARYFDAARAALLESPFLAKVAEEETAMRPTLEPGDELLLECSWRARRRPRPDAIYAIEWRGLSYLCRCQAVSGGLVTAVESKSRSPVPARIPVEDGKVEQIIRGEAVWYGRLLRGR